MRIRPIFFGKGRKKYSEKTQLDLFAICYETAICAKSTYTKLMEIIRTIIDKDTEYNFIGLH